MVTVLGTFRGGAQGSNDVIQSLMPCLAENPGISALGNALTVPENFMVSKNMEFGQGQPECHLMVYVTCGLSTVHHHTLSIIISVSELFFCWSREQGQDS